MPTETYTCSHCDGTFEKGWQDDEAAAEQQRDFPEFKKEDCVVVCDDCYKKFTEWFNAN